MQSWGTQSRFTIRDAGMEPSKSGVIGLLCAALGKPRREQPSDGFPPLADLARLRMAVRIDREGVLRVDYHTAGGTHRRGETYGVIKADGKSRDTVTSRRHFLADARFIVGLEGEADLLAVLDRALARPRWPLFLGRKAFVPSRPVRLPDSQPQGPGLRDGDVEEVLQGYPWPADPDVPERLRMVLDAPLPDAESVRRDLPLDFASRRFGLRHVATSFLRRP